VLVTARGADPADKALTLFETQAAFAWLSWWDACLMARRTYRGLQLFFHTIDRFLNVVSH
jgi:hypothetical protein